MSCQEGGSSRLGKRGRRAEEKELVGSVLRNFSCYFSLFLNSHGPGFKETEQSPHHPLCFSATYLALGSLTLELGLLYLYVCGETTGRKIIVDSCLIIYEAFTCVSLCDPHNSSKVDVIILILLTRNRSSRKRKKDLPVRSYSFCSLTETPSSSCARYPLPRKRDRFPCWFGIRMA